MCPPRPCATCPACLRTRRRAAVTQRPDALYADRGYDHDKYRKQVARLGSSRSSPVAASNMIPGWPCTAGSLSRVSPYCTGSAGSASDGKSATTSTKPSSASLAPSSAGDASTTSQTVRSSKCPRGSGVRTTGEIVGPVLAVLVAVAHQAGGDRVAVGLVTDKDSAEVVAGRRVEEFQEHARLASKAAETDRLRASKDSAVSGVTGTARRADTYR
jgi:hypothetical protein